MQSKRTYSVDQLLKAYRLAYFLFHDKNVALRITILACDVISKVHKIQHGAKIPDEVLLQFAIYLAVIKAEQDEKVFKEVVGPGYRLTREDLIIRYVLHLIWLSSRMKSCYVAVALGSLLYRYTPTAICKVGSGCFDDSNIRRVKSRIVKGLKERFEQAGTIKQELEDLKEVAPNSSEYLLIQQSLRVFTPWGQNLSQYPSKETLFEALFDVELNSPDWDRTCALIDPDQAGIESLIRWFKNCTPAIRLADPSKMLAIPAFEDHPSGNPTNRLSPPALLDSEIFLLKRAVEGSQIRQSVEVDSIELSEELYTYLAGSASEKVGETIELKMSGELSSMLRAMFLDACSIVLKLERSLCQARPTYLSIDFGTSAIRWTVDVHEAASRNEESMSISTDIPNNLAEQQHLAEAQPQIEISNRAAGMSNLLIAIGGTGARCAEAFKILWRALYPPKAPAIRLLSIDPDHFDSYDKVEEWKNLYHTGSFGSTGNFKSIPASWNTIYHPARYKSLNPTLRCSVCKSSAFECQGEEHVLGFLQEALDHLRFWNVISSPTDWRTAWDLVAVGTHQVYLPTLLDNYFERLFRIGQHDQSFEEYPNWLLPHAKPAQSSRQNTSPGCGGDLIPEVIGGQMKYQSIMRHGWRPIGPQIVSSGGKHPRKNQKFGWSTISMGSVSASKEITLDIELEPKLKNIDRQKERGMSLKSMSVACGWRAYIPLSNPVIYWTSSKPETDALSDFLLLPRITLYDQIQSLRKDLEEREHVLLSIRLGNHLMIKHRALQDSMRIHVWGTLREDEQCFLISPKRFVSTNDTDRLQRNISMYPISIHTGGVRLPYYQNRTESNGPLYIATVRPLVSSPVQVTIICFNPLQSPSSGIYTIEVTTGFHLARGRVLLSGRSADIGATTWSVLAELGINPYIHINESIFVEMAPPSDHHWEQLGKVFYFSGHGRKDEDSSPDKWPYEVAHKRLGSIFQNKYDGCFFSKSDYFVVPSLWPTKLKQFVRKETKTMKKPLDVSQNGCKTMDLTGVSVQPISCSGKSWDRTLGAIAEPQRCSPDRFNPPPLREEDFEMIQCSMNSLAQRRKNLTVDPHRLKVCVDGKERMQLHPQANSSRPFRIPIESLFLEVCAEDDQGELVLAAFLVPDPDSLETGDPYEESVTTEAGQIIGCTISPILSKARRTIGCRAQITWKQPAQGNRPVSQQALVECLAPGEKSFCEEKYDNCVEECI